MTKGKQSLKESSILLALLAIVLILVFNTGVNFILKKEVAQLELSKNVEYRYGDSPADANGIFEWTKDSDTSWKKGAIKKAGKNEDSRYLWVKVQLPAQLTDPIGRDPILYSIQIRDRVEVYIDNQKIYQAGPVGLVEFQRYTSKLIPLKPQHLGKTAYIRVYSSQGAKVKDLSIASQSDINKYLVKSNLKELSFGFIFVFIGSLCFVLFLWNRREISMLFLSLMVFGYGVGRFKNEPLSVLLPDYHTLIIHIKLIGYVVMGFSIITLVFKSFEPDFRKTAKVFRYLQVVFAVLYVYENLFGYDSFYRIANLLYETFMGIAAITGGVIAAILSRKRKSPEIRILTAGYYVFMFFIILSQLNNISPAFRPKQPMLQLIWDQHMSNWGFFALICVLALVVFMRIKRKMERTDELEKALRQLKLTQNQLVQSEKLASLGQLTAGIAHEINNPINFVSSNITPLKRNIADVMEVLQAYEKQVDASKLTNEFSEIKELKEDIDFEFTVQEIDELLKGIDDGAKRTAEIVKGLRNFSRLDEDDLKEADLAEGLDSTLMILKHRLGGRIHVTKDYAALPPIECYPGKLNQVFMNILSNAIDAIPDEGHIHIRTAMPDHEHVEVSIRDTGKGIPDEIKSKIFDPFFTTKDVGVGTGLGLAISFGIIQQHQGTIRVESKVGEGTEFIITLPMNQIAKKVS